MKLSYPILILFFVSFAYTTSEQTSMLPNISGIIHSQLQSIEQCYSNFKTKYKECLYSCNIREWFVEKCKKHGRTSVDIYNRYSIKLYTKMKTNVDDILKKIKEITIKGRKNLEKSIYKKEEEEEKERNKVL